MFYVLLIVVAVLALLYLFLESYNAFVESRKLGERDARDGQLGRHKGDISRAWTSGAVKAFLFLVVLLGTPLLFDYLSYWHLPAWVPLSQAYFAAQATPGTSDTPRAKLKQRLDDLDSKIQDLEKKKNALYKVVTDLKKDRDGLVEELKKEGITSSKDVQGKPELEKKAAKLQTVVQEMDFYKGKLDEYSKALDDGQDARKKAGRQLILTDAGISDKDLEDAEVAIAILNQKIKRETGTPTIDPLRADAALDKALGAKD